jgi:2-oxoglutarate/2-oxoacid ferredoxin oxidoreductase subunit alpha
LRKYESKFDYPTYGEVVGLPLDFIVMIAGEAGQGIQSMVSVLTKTMVRGGLHVFSDLDYESRVRGGHTFTRTRISDSLVRAISEDVDILIALNRESIDLHRGELRHGGRIIFDTAALKVDFSLPGFLNVPLEKLAETSGGNKLMSNTVALGTAVGLMGFDFDLLAEVLKAQFTKAGEEVQEGNVKAARAGFEFVKQEALGPLWDIRPAAGERRMIINGNEALALGAMAAGCKFLPAYPMTPTSSIMEYIADKGRKYNIAVIQPEDEISAINMVVGASYAGARSMTVTSGSGFALMIEGLGLAGITETPVVVVLGQRPGPAVGLPTRTEQGELDFTIFSGTGEFPRAVLAPASVEDAFWSAVKAFNLADRYQTPVIIITDNYLANSYTDAAKFDLKQVIIDRGELLTAEQVDKLAEYKRHLVTGSGISPRAVPLQGKALVVTDSDEHNEEGHLIEDAATRGKMVLKRLRKYDGLKQEIAVRLTDAVPDAELTLVGWGSTYGAIKEAMLKLRADGIPVNLLHLNEIWPFPADAVSVALNSTPKSVVIENNATGQLAHLIRRETGYTVSGTINRFDGRPLTPRFIVNALKKEVA